MAKKKTERKASNSKEATIWQSILKSEKTDFLVGMMIAILAIHLTVSMVSYINTGAEDRVCSRTCVQESGSTMTR